MTKLSPREVARRALPWIITPEFKNLLLEMPGRDVESYPEIILNDIVTVYIPGASRFLVSSKVSFDMDIDRRRRKIAVNIVEGYVYGFLPNGQYIKLRPEKVLKNTTIELSYKNSYTEFAVANIVKNYLRISAGPVFAAIAEQYAEKNGIWFSKAGEPKKVKVILAEREVYTEITFPTKLYRAGTMDKKEIVTAPGIIPAILALIRRQAFNPVKGEAYDIVKNFLKDVTSVGKRLVTLTPTLQSTSKTKFTYIAGEASGPDQVFDRMGKAQKLVWLTGGKAHRGTRVDFYLNTENRKIYMTISILPFSAPATTILNYPPYNIAPLAALMHDSYNTVRYLAGTAKKHLASQGLKTGLYIDDYAVLADAKLSINEIRRLLIDGYPRLENLYKILGKLEKLGYVGDIMAHAYGKESKVDIRLLEEVKRVIGEEKEEKTTTKPSETVEEEELVF